MTEVTVGSGNVFEDLGYRDPEEAKAKANLAWYISSVIKQRGLTQVEAAEILGIDQPKVSNLVRGKLRDFSLERLIRFVIALGNDVRIEVNQPDEQHIGHGHLKVYAA